MSNSNNDAALFSVLSVLTVGISVVAGIISWSWVQPDSIFGFIGFLALMGILTAIGRFLVLGIIALFSKRN